MTTGTPPAEIAELLGLGPDEKTVIRARRYLIDGHPVRLGTSYLPASVAADTPLAEPNPGPGGIYARLEEQGLPLEYVTEAVTARMPTPDEANALRLASGVPVMRVLRVAFASGDRPVEVGDSLMAADVYVLDYRVSLGCGGYGPRGGARHRPRSGRRRSQRATLQRSGRRRSARTRTRT